MLILPVCRWPLFEPDLFYRPHAEGTAVALHVHSLDNCILDALLQAGCPGALRNPQPAEHRHFDQVQNESERGCRGKCPGDHRER